MDGMGSMDGWREEKMEEWMDGMGWMDGGVFTNGGSFRAACRLDRLTSR